MTDYAAIANRLREIAGKIGSSTNPRWIVEQLESLASGLLEQARLSKTCKECGLPATHYAFGEPLCKKHFDEVPF